MNLESLVSKAILAPSGHNTQAWKFSLTENEEICLSPDFSRALPVIDPLNRELFISLGCALENIVIYAQSLGYKPNVTEENGNILISFTELASIQNMELALAIDTRQTNRSVYNGKTIPLEHLFKLKRDGACIYSNGSEEFKQVSKLVDIANNIQMGNHQFKQELKQWLRYNEKDATKNGDGISYETLGAPYIPSVLRKLVVPLGLNSSSQSKSDIRKLSSSSHLAIFTGSDTISEWIDLGRRLERFLLTAETLGLACAYMNQPCELNTTREILKVSLNLDKQPQIILRIGYAKRTPKSHRRPLSTFLKYISDK